MATTFTVIGRAASKRKPLKTSTETKRRRNLKVRWRDKGFVTLYLSNMEDAFSVYASIRSDDGVGMA
ncbi:hypothetical protein CHS0354_003182 [Potamilus streckersoni]|uniref:Uncharacterized protein n=1 Tax=Potamilus streckersoni TaxID=2493646 RepID=A0AAE0TF06_9BIVA|nr:hypothetical protein CHS0354_003182 [Potamilus streckersoni]